MPRQNSLVALLVLSMALSACEDPSAQQHQQAGESLYQAITLIDEGDQGYVSPDVGDPTDQVGFRHGRYSQAIEHLDEVASTGSPTQRSAARRLKADLVTARARRTARDAQQQWASIANHGATVLGFVAAVTRTDAQVKLFDVDESQLLAALENQLRDTGKREAQLKNHVEALKKQLADLSAQRKQQVAKRDQAIKRAADLRSQAFVTEGEHRYELELQTIVTQREADATTSEIDKLDLQITVRSSEMVMVEQQWTLSTSAIEAVKRQIDDAETRHNKVEELRQAAVAARNKATNDLASHLANMVTEFNDKVNTPLDDAAADIKDAISALESEAKKSTGDKKSRHIIQFDELSKRLAYVHLLNQHLTAARSGHGVLAVVAEQAQRSIPTQSGLFAQNAKPFHENVTRIGATLSGAIDEARTIANDLAENANETIANHALNSQDLLDAYARQAALDRLPQPFDAAAGESGAPGS